MINKVILLGRLGKNPETKEFSEGKNLTKFSLATNKKWKDNKGEPQESTEWHNIVCFGGLAKICAEYLAKGSQVYVEGEIRTRSYEKDGETKYMTEIHGSNVQFLGSKGKEDSIVDSF